MNSTLEVSETIKSELFAPPSNFRNLTKNSKLSPFFLNSIKNKATIISSEEYTKSYLYR
jgi:hypothetical protein